MSARRQTTHPNVPFHPARALLGIVFLSIALVFQSLPASAAPGFGGSMAPRSAQQESGQIAFLREGNLWLMNADGSDQRQLTDYEHPVRDFSWSPSGRYLLVQSGGRQVVAGDVVQADRVTDLIDVITGDSREITRSTDSMSAEGPIDLPAWASDADELIQLSIEGGKTYSLTLLGLDGSETWLASFQEPNICGGPDGPSITIWTLAREQTGGGWGRPTYPPLVWNSGAQTAWVNPSCGESWSVDLASGVASPVMFDPMFAIGTKLLVYGEFSGSTPPRLFDPATGSLIPLVEGDRFGPGPNGTILFTRNVPGATSPFQSRFDDVPASTTDNTIELWQTDLQATPSVLIATFPAFAAGVPRLTADGAAVVLGIVDNPSELIGIDESAERFSLATYAAHVKAIRVELASGAVSVLSDDVILPKPQPAIPVDSPIDGVPEPTPSSTLVAAEPIGTSSNNPANSPFIENAPIMALVCESSAEGFWISAGGGMNMPEGCGWANGATFTLTGPNGESFGSCQITDFLCLGEIWMQTGVDVTVTWDEATLPDGYAVDGGNPKTFLLPAEKIGSDSEQWLFVLLPDGAASEPVADNGMTIAPGSDWIAYIGADGNVWLMQPDGSQQTQLTFDGTPDAWYQAPAWSHDGSMLVFTRPAQGSVSRSTAYLLRDGIVAQIPGIYGCDHATFMPGDTKIALTCARDGDSNASQQTLQTDPSMGLVSVANLDGSDWRVLASYNQADTNVWPTAGIGPGAMVPTSISVAPDGTVYFGSSTQQLTGLGILYPGASSATFLHSPMGGSMNANWIDAADALLVDVCKGCYVHTLEDPQISFAWMASDGTIHSTVLTLDPAVRVGSPTISPDGGTLVYPISQGSYPWYGPIQSRDLATGVETTIGTGIDPVWQPNPIVAMQLAPSQDQPDASAGGSSTIEPSGDAAVSDGLPEPNRDELMSYWAGKTWTGTGDQQNPANTWPMTVSLSDGAVGDVVGTVDYPTLGCGGELILLEILPDDFGAIRTGERITYGHDNCLDGGVFVFSLAESGLSMNFRWEHPSSPTTASGVLYPS